LIPIIDLFAGPGGLGEGFMSLKDNEGKSVFDIKLSIEKDENAHKTLTWRSFYRQFEKAGKPIPKEYYQAYQATKLAEREQLIEDTLDKYPEGKKAEKEAWLCELGNPKFPSQLIDARITEGLKGSRDWLLIGGPPCQACKSSAEVGL
jgi:DNA (cytosine-5)-methyltransferase 1